jgi:hypothetical protein
MIFNEDISENVGHFYVTNQQLLHKRVSSFSVLYNDWDLLNTAFGKHCLLHLQIVIIKMIVG